VNRTIIFPTATLVKEDGSTYDGVEELLDALHLEGDRIILLSHNRTKLSSLLRRIEYAEFVNRRDIRRFIENEESHLYILVGSSDVDLQLAANKKLLLLNPLWSEVQEEKAITYGLGVSSPEGLSRVLKILKNQRAWYYTLQVDDTTEVYALSRANYKGYVESETEVELVKAFERILKEGDKRYFKLLLTHFLGSIINNKDFKHIDIWAIMPSSGTELNEDMFLFKERARLIMGKKNSQPLFLRHTPIQKSRGLADKERMPCDRHFDTIVINPFYKNKLAGKSVCVLDDYLNNGTSFETLRNLLVHEGVKRIVFVSLGRFQRRTGTEYLKQDYTLSGNLYEKGYAYSLGTREELHGNFNEQARHDIRELHKIINS
jgi:hypothetical protein